MFKKLFSCLNDNSIKDQVDLSNHPIQPTNNPNKPYLHPDSNVNG